MAEENQVYFTDNAIMQHVIKSRDCQHGVGFTYDFCPIVRAVNNYGVLVAALREAKESIRILHGPNCLGYL